VKLRFHRAALEELGEAASWYERHRPGLGDELLAELDAAVVAVVVGPQAWPKVGTAGLRRFVLPRFPYSVIYGIHDDELRVFAIAHQKRRPGYWAARTFNGDAAG
jgi:plasmid stabilization system protein ParE